MSLDKLSVRASRLIITAALAPAVVVAILILLQGSTLPNAPAVPSVPADYAHVKLSPEIARLTRAQSRAALQTARDQLASSAGARSDALTYGWIAAVLLLALGIGGAWLLAGELAAKAQRDGGRAIRDPSGAARTTPAQIRLEHDRELLVEACIEVSDSIESQALREELLRALAGAGVTAVEIPANTRFDPAVHKAADTLATHERTLDGLVAETERSGFVDRGRRRRWPEVVVYRADGRRSG